MSKTSMFLYLFCFANACLTPSVWVYLFTYNMSDFVLFVKPKLAMMCLPSLSPPSWLPSFRSTLAAPLLSSAMKRVVKYRWQIGRLKILQAFLGNFCAKIPFFFCLSVLFTTVLYTWRRPVFAFYFVYSLNILASVLVLFCFSHMVIIDTYIVFDCSLFLLLLSFIVVRCEMSCGIWDCMSQVRSCVSRRTQCCQRQSLLFSSTHSRALNGRWTMSMMYACVGAWNVGWKQIKQSFSTGFLCFIFNV